MPSGGVKGPGLTEPPSDWWGRRRASRGAGVKVAAAPEGGYPEPVYIEDIEFDRAYEIGPFGEAVENIKRLAGEYLQHPPMQQIYDLVDAVLTPLEERQRVAAEAAEEKETTVLRERMLETIYSAIYERFEEAFPGEDVTHEAEGAWGDREEGVEKEIMDAPLKELKSIEADLSGYLDEVVKWWRNRRVTEASSRRTRVRVAAMETWDDWEEELEGPDPSDQTHKKLFINPVHRKDTEELISLALCTTNDPIQDNEILEHFPSDTPGVDIKDVAVDNEWAVSTEDVEWGKPLYV
jgi:hypothetical protein